ncbi:MAG: DUF2334 domain-containing protein [Lachnospiraceae bacterium]|nr:DUF2334 domain-containing protein [Lachnospiraceae bacterium]
MKKSCASLLTLLLSIAVLLLTVLADTGKAEAASNPYYKALVITSHGLGSKDDTNVRSVGEILMLLDLDAEYIYEEELADCDLSEYEVVIWYMPREDSEAYPHLRRYMGHLMMLGNMVPMRDHKEDIRSITDKANVRLEYTFRGEKTVTKTLVCDGISYFEDTEYQKGSLWVDNKRISLICGDEKLRYVCFADYKDNFAKAVLAEEIDTWLNADIDADDIYNQYIVLDNVYPFMDPEVLLETVNYLIDSNMPYVISVMPIYAHGDYPAMQQFTDIIRYAQDRNGSVILGEPTIQTRVEPEELAGYLKLAQDAYYSNGVYPVGLEIPSEWTLNKDLQGVLSKYSTLFLHDTAVYETVEYKSMNNRYIIPANRTFIKPVIALDHGGASYIDAYPGAVYIDMSMDMDHIREMIDSAARSTIPCGDLMNRNHLVGLDDTNILRYKDGVMTLGSEIRDLTYVEEPVDEDFDYNRSVYYRATASLVTQNKYLTGFSLVALAVFLTMLFLARRQMKRRFFLSDVPPSEPPEPQARIAKSEPPEPKARIAKSEPPEPKARIAKSEPSKAKTAKTKSSKGPTKK